jgi:hypothetical protein
LTINGNEKMKKKMGKYLIFMWCECETRLSPINWH